MAIVTAASIRYFKAYSGGKRMKRIEITLDKSPRFLYEKLKCNDGVAYLGFDKDNQLGSFFFHDPHNQTGFGGSLFELQLKDGTIEIIKGPWSSSESAMNALFELSDPLVNCTEKYTVRHVRKSVLDSFGIPLEFHKYSDGTGYWDVKEEEVATEQEQAQAQKKNVLGPNHPVSRANYNDWRNNK